MGNAEAIGFEYLIPRDGGGNDLIVLGLQESTYSAAGDEDIARKSSSVQSLSAEPVQASAAPSSRQKPLANQKSSILSSLLSITGEPSTRKNTNARCVEITLSKIEDILGHHYELVRVSIYFYSFHNSTLYYRLSTSRGLRCN
jgi:hypothetical protein